MRPFVLFFSLIAVAQTASAQSVPAETDDSDEIDSLARDVFLRGEAAFQEGEYLAALDAFQEAYELSPRPELQYNIGHTNQLLGRNDHALRAYRQYLEALPNAENRPSVEARMRAIVARSSARALAARAAETEPPSSGPGAAPWLLMGGGVLAAATGTVLLVMAGSAAANVEQAPSGTAWASLQSDYNRSETFGPIGVSAVGVGAALTLVGAIWLIAAPSAESEVEVSMGPSGAAVRGTF